MNTRGGHQRLQLIDREALAGEFQIQQRIIGSVGDGLVASGDVDCGITDFYGGVPGDPGGFLPAVRYAVGEVERFGRRSSAFAKFQVLQLRGSVTREDLSVGDSVQVDIGEQRDACIGIEKTRSHRIVVLQRNLHVAWAGRGVITIEWAKSAGYVDRAARGQIRVQVERNLRGEDRKST